MAKQQTLQVDLSDVVRFLRSLGVDAVEVESYTIDLTQDSEMECGDGRVVNGIDLISLKKSSSFPWLFATGRRQVS